MDEVTTVFVCPDSLDGILTGVFDAWDSGLGHKMVRLEIRQEATLELFCEYRQVETDIEKAKKVLQTVERRLGEEASIHICQAAACSGFHWSGEVKWSTASPLIRWPLSWS